jgi:hypothetical protein
MAAIYGAASSVRFLAIGSEWFSRRGGVSTLNRGLCMALATAGHEVFCLVPTVRDAEREEARAHGVTLLEAPQAIGLSDEARLSLPVAMEPPDVVIGHGPRDGARRCSSRYAFLSVSV